MMRSWAVLVLAAGLLAGPVLASRPGQAVRTPIHRLRQLERALVQRFGALCGAGGVRATAGFAGGVHVRMAVAPAHRRDGQPRAWTDVEARKIVKRMREVLAREFPDVVVLGSSGIELEPLRAGLAKRVVTVRMVEPPAPVATAAAQSRAPSQLGQPGRSRARSRLGAPGQARVRSLLGAPEAPAPDPPPSPSSDAAASPEAGAPPTAPDAAAPPAAPDAAASPASGTSPDAAAVPPPPPPLPGGEDVPASAAPPAAIELPSADGGTVNVAPVVTQTIVTPAPAAAPVTVSSGPTLASVYPAQPGGYGHVAFPISAAASLPTTVYQYPRDNDALEYLIERELGVALRSTFKDAKVHARMIRPQVVRMDIEVAMTGAYRENVDHILHFTRDTTLGVFKQKFNLLRIHHKTRIRLTEADDRFSYDFRFHELTPYGHHDRHEEDPLFRGIRMERPFVIDVPRAFMIGRDATSITVGALSRTVSPGVYSNVQVSTSNAYHVTFRRGFWERLEASLGFYSYSNDLVPTARGLFTNSTSGLSAVTFGARYRMPYELNGFALAVGLTHSFQPGGERQFYLPDDFERLYNLYVVGSRRFWENLLVHVSAKRTSINEKPDFEDNALNSFGLGFEYVVFERAIMMVEMEAEQYTDGALGPFGTINDGDGFNVNAGAVVGTSLGDIEISGRKLAKELEREVDVSVSYRW